MANNVEERRRTIVEDETRMAVLALSRAKSNAMVVAVANQDTRPSAYLNVLSARRTHGEAWVVQPPPPPLDLRGVVASARRQLLGADGAPDQAGPPDQADRLLGLLAAIGVQGAHPDQWPGVLGLSSEQPAARPDRPVVLAGSQVETLDKCPLRWALEAAGGKAQGGVQATVGSLIHRLAGEHPMAGPAELAQLLDQAWDELGLEPGYSSDLSRAQANRMVTKLGLYQQEQAREHPPVAQELRLSVELPVGPTVDTSAQGDGEPPASQATVRVVGRIDRLEAQPDGTVMVVDYKTGAVLPTKSEALSNPQLGVYQMAVDAGGLEGWEDKPLKAGGAQLVGLGGATQKASIRSQLAVDQSETPNWVSDLLRRCWEAATGASLPATPNSGCDHCRLKACCPAQEQGRQVTA
jgi:hypothetical protein